MVELQTTDLLFAEPCWYIVDKVNFFARITHTLCPYQLTAVKDNQGATKIFKLTEFEQSCGMSKEISKRLFDKANRKHIAHLENVCGIKFLNCDQAYEKKKIELTLADPPLPSVPLWVSLPRLVNTASTPFSPAPTNTSSTPSRMVTPIAMAEPFEPVEAIKKLIDASAQKCADNEGRGTTGKYHRTCIRTFYESFKLSREATENRKKL